MARASLVLFIADLPPNKRMDEPESTTALLMSGHKLSRDAPRLSSGKPVESRLTNARPGWPTAQRQPSPEVLGNRLRNAA
jgi:hypothetical protein